MYIYTHVYTYTYICLHIYTNSLNLGPEDLIITAEMLKINTNLTSLSLRHNSLIGNGSEFHACEILAEWLAEASNLTKLDLSHTNLRDAGCVRISKGLEKQGGLKVGFVLVYMYIYTYIHKA